MSNLNNVLDISDLSFAAIYEKPVEFCWYDFPDRWEVIIPENCNEESWHEFEPMMNYYYSLPYLGYSDSAAQEILCTASLPLVVANLEDETVLTLSGGGMDLSWAICEAYIRLGYYPPYHFSLPEMAGRYNVMVRDACIKSAEAVATQATRRIETLKNLTCC